VPPERPIIRDINAVDVLNYEVGPFEVDQDLVLECEVHGGKLFKLLK